MLLVLIKTSVWFVRIYLQNDINWGEILSSNSGPTVVGSHTGPVRALASCRGRICSASDDGFILVWPPRPAVRDEEPDPPRRLGGGAGSVWALASWGGWLISGGVDSILRVRRRRARAGARSGFSSPSPRQWASSKSDSRAGGSESVSPPLAGRLVAAAWVQDRSTRIRSRRFQVRDPGVLAAPASQPFCAPRPVRPGGRAESWADPAAQRRRQRQKQQCTVHCSP